MQKPKQPRSNWKDILIILSFIVALISIAVNGLFTQKLQEILGLESVTQVPTTATNSPAIPGVPTAGTSEVTQVPPTSTNPPTHFTQSGPINLSPDSANYSYTISSWSKPAYNNYCQLATCDPTSERKDLLREGRVVTATCWTYGQRVITGTLDNPGYDDNRWVRLEDGTYLANTWFVRTNLLTSQLPTC